jgi:hypothetical protein
MRRSITSARAGILAAVAVAILAGLGLSAVRAAAEAPYFYDDLSIASIYDPDFDPAMRQAGLLALVGQAWSRPDNGDPRQNLGDQDYVGEYRLQWWATLDPRYSLLVELKGSDKDQVVADDYFLRTEFVYQDLPVAMWVYGGMRVPEGSEDPTVWFGVESMSHRIGDLFPGAEDRVPVAFRGYAELRYDFEDNDPVLRLTALGHTVSGWGVPDLTLGTALDTFFQEGNAPRWILQFHADYQLTHGAARVSVVSGYGLDLDSEGEQRLSLGARLGLF